ncbi:ALF repeat-containing protein [Streptomyces sp. A1-5]|uniref:ALF repeat-containing protein n=1 Tax=Streptomyces sp. A1-5 TaxID=2738410 RepID=UPI001F2C0595|nr:ALF repeat-containing protein [Streptomyces sp. A1-5]UJB44842.1 ALF repeat-containing protein [Streptomyces sp. A1-5]
MKLSRISTVVAAAAIAPAVLFASPAVAADTATPPASSTPDTAPDAKPDTQGNAKADKNNRFAILKILSDQNSGPGVRKAAEAALNSTPEDRVHFLGVGRQQAQDVDDRVRTSQILHNGGPKVKEAANKALDGTMEDIRYFLEVGQYEARAKDKADAKRFAEQAAKDVAEEAAKDAAKNKHAPGTEGKHGEADKPATSEQHTHNAGDRGADAKPAVAPGQDTAKPSQNTGAQLAASGAGPATPWAIGGTAIALTTGAGLVLASRRRTSTEN